MLFVARKEAREGSLMISTFFIMRPIVSIVIAIVTVIAGLVSMRALPLAQFPQIVPPQIITSTTYTGADAVTIEHSTHQGGIVTKLTCNHNGGIKTR